MKIDHLMLVNKFGQGIVLIKELLDIFYSLNEIDQQIFTNELIELILQSKPSIVDIHDSIEGSGIKKNSTACIIARGGPSYNTFRKMVNLPKQEQERTLILLLNIFKLSYHRRFLMERNNNNKWWYWDLNDENNVNYILQQYANPIDKP